MVVVPHLTHRSQNLRAPAVEEGGVNVKIAAGEALDSDSFVTAANDDLKNNNKYLNYMSHYMRKGITFLNSVGSVNIVRFIRIYTK